MKIVNPLYDNAFKYLMDNEQIAKKVLSIILGQQIIVLQSKPQEVNVNPDIWNGMARYDFKAIVRNEQNEEQAVLIELQKYRTPNPIVRFREYLAENYKKEETIVNAQGEEVKQALPIITIYILGYKVTQAEVLALKVDRVLKDIIWDVPVNEMPDFVELLTHTSIIIQVDAKPKEFRNTRLERFISLFSQKLRNEPSNYVIDVDTNDATRFDTDMSDIVSHLNMATLDEKVVRSLKYEQSLAEGIKAVEREIAETLERIEMIEAEVIEAKAKADANEAKANEAKAEANEAKAEADKAKAKAEQERLGKEAANQSIINMVKYLHQMNTPLEQITAMTGKTEEEIMSIISTV